MEVARKLLPAFEDGVYFIDLTPVTGAPMLFATIGQALGIKPITGDDFLADLGHALRDKRILLVLDNFEQIADAGAEVVRLLEMCPGIEALITSREALHVRGEQQLVVPPLKLPNSVDDLSPEALLDYASVALFVERAREVRSDFTLTVENAPAVAKICTRLDGLPLAIELAAAQVKVLSLADVLARLDRRLALLTDGARDLPLRHQTLQAAIDWSYDLLSRRERTLFACFSVFAGGCDLDAVEAVCSDLRTLRSLLDKSLVQQGESPVMKVEGQVRFYMLESIREHAMTRLEDSGDAREMRSYHATYYLSVVEQADGGSESQDERQRLDRLEQEHDNIRAALRWALSVQDYEIAARIAGGMLRFWDVRGYWSEGRQWLDPVIAQLEILPAKVGATAALAASRLAYLQDDNDMARTLSEQSLRLYREVGFKPGIAQALGSLAYLAARLGDREAAISLLEEALTMSREVGDRRKVASILGNLGRLAMESGDYERASALEREALALFRGLNDRSGTASTLANLGQLAAEKSDFELSVSLLEESLALNRELGDKGHSGWVLGDLGIATLAAGDYERSMSVYADAARLFVELGDKSGLATALFMRGVALAYMGGDPESAASSFEESLRLCREIGDEAGCAPALDGLAFLAAGAGDLQRAARMLGAAETVRGKAGYRVGIIELPLHERIIALLHAGMNEGDLAAAIAKGRGMGLEQAIAYALNAVAISDRAIRVLERGGQDGVSSLSRVNLK